MRYVFQFRLGWDGLNAYVVAQHRASTRTVFFSFIWSVWQPAWNQNLYWLGAMLCWHVGRMKDGDCAAHEYKIVVDAISSWELATRWRY